MGTFEEDRSQNSQVVRRNIVWSTWDWRVISGCQKYSATEKRESCLQGADDGVGVCVVQPSEGVVGDMPWR